MHRLIYYSIPCYLFPLYIWSSKYEVVDALHHIYIKYIHQNHSHSLLYSSIYNITLIRFCIELVLILDQSAVQVMPSVPAQCADAGVDIFAQIALYRLLAVLLVVIPLMFPCPD